MKRAVVLLMSFSLLTSLLLSGCNSSPSSNTNNNSNPPSNNSAASSAPTPSAEDPAVTLIYSGEESASNTRGMMMEKFAELVSKKSKGNITIDVYLDGKLGTAREALEAMQTAGDVDLVCTVEPLSYWTDVVNVLSVPYVFDDEDHVDAFMNSEAGQEFCQAMLDAANVRVLTYAPTDPRVVTSNREITCLADMQGMTIRVPETATGPIAFEAMGCKVTTMAFSELFSALQQGVIEAQENPLNFMVTNSFYEVQKYVAVTNHSVTLPFLFISEASWNKLTENQQNILLEAAEESRLYEKQLRADMEQEVLETLDKNGIVIHEVDRDEFKNAVQTIYPKLSETVQYWIEKIQAVEH